VHDAPGRLRHPQGKVIVLREIVLTTESSHIFNQRLTIHCQVPSQHAVEHEFRRPVGLEDEIEQFSCRRVIHLAFVRIDEIEVRLPVYCFNNTE
jgi:hypothetical protein